MKKKMKNTKIKNVGVVIAISCLLQVSALGEVEKLEDSRVLYGVPGSPYVKKVMVILKEKNIAFKHVAVPPALTMRMKKQEVPVDFAEASPLGKVPAFREGDWTAADSAVIAQYLERTHPVPAMYPVDPKGYARALWFEKYGDEVLAAVIHKKIFGERVVKPTVFNIPGDEAVAKKALEEELPPLLDYLEKELGNEQWIAGEFSVADIAIGTHFFDLRIAGESVSKERWPKLASYVNRVCERCGFADIK